MSVPHITFYLTLPYMTIRPKVWYLCLKRRVFSSLIANFIECTTSYYFYLTLLPYFLPLIFPKLPLQNSKYLGMKTFLLLMLFSWDYYYPNVQENDRDAKLNEKSKLWGDFKWKKNIQFRIAHHLFWWRTQWVWFTK